MKLSKIYNKVKTKGSYTSATITVFLASNSDIKVQVKYLIDGRASTKYYRELDIDIPIRDIGNDKVKHLGYDTYHVVDIDEDRYINIYTIEEKNSDYWKEDLYDN